MTYELDPTLHVEVPYEELSSTALRGVIESFVLREGTDYGDETFTLDHKVDQVLAQLKKGAVKIVFNVKEETFDMLRNA